MCVLVLEYDSLRALGWLGDFFDIPKVPKCWGLESHCFHVIRDGMFINPIVGVYMRIIRIPY